MSHATIAAIATPKGFGGVGIVRISGPLVHNIVNSLTNTAPPPRQAVLRYFFDGNGNAIDQGLVLLFTAPNSFTGEDVLELHGHGGPVVLDLLLQRVLSLGARLARPGEFTERAYLADKLDLAQAEAVADLITSSTEAAARASVRTLQGKFSSYIRELETELLNLRTYVEGAIDFADDDVDWLTDDHLLAMLDNIINNQQNLLRNAHQGQLLRDGITLVIAGTPNAGKSSLLNALAGKDTAIVTPWPGTTRDLLREHIHIDGMPVNIVDTAGIRDVTDDIVEREGIRRALEAVKLADRILWVFDDRADPHHEALILATLPNNIPITLVRNKIDLTGTTPGIINRQDQVEVAISAAGGAGIADLREHLKDCVGYTATGDGEFMARRRHLEALNQAANHLQQAKSIAITGMIAEVFAEELRQAQNALGQITGEISPEDVLAEIFAQFCIGK